MRPRPIPACAAALLAATAGAAAALSPFALQWQCRMEAGTDGLTGTVWLTASGDEVWAEPATDGGKTVFWELRTIAESGMTFGAPDGPGHTLTINPGPDIWETFIDGAPVLVATCEDL